jgi:hypothetical protein
MRSVRSLSGSPWFAPQALLFTFFFAVALVCGLFLLLTIPDLLSDKHFPSDSGALFLKCARLVFGGFGGCYVGMAIGHLIGKIQYPDWMPTWESLQWILYAEYTCSTHEGSRGREVRVCLPHPVESKRWGFHAFPDDVSTPVVAFDNRKQEYVLKAPWKPLVVLKSKKGFGVWNAEANLRIEQVDFTPDEVVLTCDLLNDEGASLPQRREYRIPWRKRRKPTSGVLKGSGGIETRPYDSENAFPEYVPADSQP